MASIFKKSYTKVIKGKRVTRYARKYTIKYKDEHGQWRTKTGTTDKGLTQRMAATVEYEVDQRRGMRLSTDVWPISLHAACPEFSESRPVNALERVTKWLGTVPLSPAILLLRS